MATGTLYTYPENFRAFKALIAARISGTSLKIAEDFVFGETNKSDAFLKKFPFGKVPAFESADGKCLTESNAIAYYVANQQLRGETDLQKAQVLQWMGFADSEVLPSTCAWVFPLLGMMPFNKQTVANAKEDLAKVMTTLNNYLLTRTYLVGERITLADICVAMTLLPLYKYVLEPTTRQPYQNVNRWFQTIVNHPAAIEVLGEFKLADKALEYDPKLYAPAGKAKKEKEPKTDSKAAERPKKEKKQAKEEEAPEELDATEAALAAEPKSNNPFDELPKGNFNMDDFKRCYSNEDEAVSVPYFWEKFDPEHYSIWLGEYKYNDELSQVFMSCNLIGGMFQRLEKMRKQAFASCCVFGENNNSSISGVWVWRGQDLAFTLSPDWQIDYESYGWTKLDPSNEEHKKLVNQYLTWTGTDKEGRKFKEGKIFK